MLHPDTEIRFINTVIGYGVVATKLIPKGTITWALDELDQIIDPKRVPGFSPMTQALVHKYAYIDGKGRHILCWDHARYVNHSCEATCLSTGYEFEMAIRDIQPGEQLTDDYGGLNIEESFECACGAPTCRGTVRPDDILRLSPQWDRQLSDTFARLNAVPQPLWPVLRCQDQVKSVLEGKSQLPSSLIHYHAP